MNHIYSLVWNRALHTLQVAPETARWHGGTAAGSARKRPRRTPTALACAAVTPTGHGRWLAASIAAALIAVLQGVAQPAVAQSSPQAAAAPVTCTWNTGNGDWNAAADWSGCNTTFPGSGNGSGFNAGVAGATVTINTSGLSVGALTVGNSAGTTSQVEATAGATDDSFSSIAIDNNATFGLDSGAQISTSGDVDVNAGGNLQVDANGSAGSTLSIGGNLVNASTANFGNAVIIGNNGMTGAATLDVGGTLTNTGGDFDMNGGSTAAAHTQVNVAGAAAPTLTGTYRILGWTGGATLHYGSGGITQIGDGTTNGGELDLFGGGSNNALVESGSAGGNSALAGLATIASNGTLNLQDGTVVTTSGSLAVNAGNSAGPGGQLFIDSAGPGGSTLTVGGNLVNASTANFGNAVIIGNSGMTAATTVNVGGTLTNTGGDFDINGGSTTTAHTQVNVTGAVDPTLTGTYRILGWTGGATLHYGSGMITQIGDGATTGGNGELDLFGNGNALIQSGSGPGNNALDNLATIASNGTLNLQAGTVVTTSGALTVSAGNSAGPGGQLFIDNSGPGGSTLTVNGNFTDSSGANFGSAVMVGSGGMANNALLAINGTLDATGGTLDISGGNAAGVTGKVTSTGAAPSTQEGTYNLTSNNGTAELQFASGGITQIGDGTKNGGAINLNGPRSYVEIGNSGSNSALSGLTTIASNGELTLQDGEDVTTTGALTLQAGNSAGGGGALFIDNAGSGGSTLTVGGNLIDNSEANFGNAVIVGVGGMTSNSLLTIDGTLDTTGGTLDINGGNPATAKVTSTGPAPSTQEGTYNLTSNNGTAELEFASGGITQIGDGTKNGGAINLNGPRSYVEIGNTSSNSALSGLTTVASNGELTLQNGANVTTTGALTLQAGDSAGGGGELFVDNEGAGGSTMTVGGNLIDTSDANFGNAVIVGVGGMTSNALLAIDGTLDTTGGSIDINGGNAVGVTGKVTSTGAAPSTQEGTYNLTSNNGTAELEFASGGITQIGDGTANGGGINLNGPRSYVEIGNTGSNSALSGLTTIASNGELTLQNGADVTTNGALTLQAGNSAGAGAGLFIDNAGSGGSTMTVGGDLVNNSDADFGNAITVGVGGMANDALLKVAGDFDNNGGGEHHRWQQRCHRNHRRHRQLRAERRQHRFE